MRLSAVGSAPSGYSVDNGAGAYTVAQANGDSATECFQKQVVGYGAEEAIVDRCDESVHRIKEWGDNQKTKAQCYEECTNDASCAVMMFRPENNRCQLTNGCTTKMAAGTDGQPNWIIVSKAATTYSLGASHTTVCATAVTDSAECQGAALAAVNGAWDGERSWTDRCHGCLYTTNDGQINFNTNTAGVCGQNSDQKPVCKSTR